MREYSNSTHQSESNTIESALATKRLAFEGKDWYQEEKGLKLPGMKTAEHC